MARAITVPDDVRRQLPWLVLTVGAALGVISGLWLAVTARPTLFSPAFQARDDAPRPGFGWAERLSLAPALGAMRKAAPAPREFDAAAWRRAGAGSDARQRMVKDLVARRLATGTPKIRVLDLLGQPDRVSSPNDWVYVVGRCGLLGVGERRLMLHFDQGGGLLIAAVKCSDA